MFIAGMSPVLEPPVNDLWTVPGEESLLERWKAEDTDFFRTIDAATYYHRRQIEEFLSAILEGSPPPVSGEEGRKTVELFTAIYRSNRDRRPVSFPLKPERERADLDGRLA
jgi:predicted dehydrogenase